MSDGEETPCGRAQNSLEGPDIWSGTETNPGPPQRNWRALLVRGRFGTLLLACCHPDPMLDKMEGWWMNPWMTQNLHHLSYMLVMSTSYFYPIWCRTVTRHRLVPSTHRFNLPNQGLVVSNGIISHCLVRSTLSLSVEGSARKKILNKSHFISKMWKCVPESKSSRGIKSTLCNLYVLATG